MADLICVRQNAYYDSVTLMTLSNKLKKMEGVQDAVVSMATDMNKELLAGINLSKRAARKRPSRPSAPSPRPRPPSPS